MSSAKSNEKAVKFREEGNDFLSDGKFFDALVAYNKSLCCAEPESLEISVTFERRSDVFFQIGQYEKCLANIQAAKDHGFPSDEIEVLNDRETSSRKLIAEGIEESDVDPLSFFKLSHSPNDKVPFIVHCLELGENEKYGRFLKTTKNLQPGDIIAIEESHFNFISPNAIYTKCFNCLRSNMLDLIPSAASVMFCSLKCCNEAYKKFNGKDDLIRDSLSGNDIRQKMLRIMSESLAAAGNFVELQKIVEGLKRQTVFDFDLSDQNDEDYKKKILICISSLMPKTDCGVANYLRGILNLPDGAKKAFFVSFIARVVLNYMRNGAKLPGKGTNLPDGGMALPFVALVNHSCDPNIYASFVDNKCVFTVIRPILAGDQIFNNYRKTFMEQPQEARKAELLKAYEFNCQCTACINNYPMPNKLRKIDETFTLPTFGHFGSNKSLIEELKKNFRYIKEDHKHHPCFETAALLIRNREIIKILGERATYP